jgi:hypothetical protein
VICHASTAQTRPLATTTVTPRATTLHEAFCSAMIRRAFSASPGSPSLAIKSKFGLDWDRSERSFGNSTCGSCREVDRSLGDSCSK